MDLNKTNSYFTHHPPYDESEDLAPLKPTQKAFGLKRLKTMGLSAASGGIPSLGF